MRLCTIDNCIRIATNRTPVLCCKMHRKRWDRKGNFDSSWYKPHNARGYLRITLGKNSPRVLLHRLIMGQHLGRELMPSEVIHHLNGDKTDNRIENLEIVTQSTHISKYHPKRVIVDWDSFTPPKSRQKICTISDCGLVVRRWSLCEKHSQSYWSNYLSKK